MEAGVSTDSSEVNPLGVGAAAVAVSSWGLATVIVKGIDMGSLAIGTYRFTIYGFVLIAIFAIRGNPLTFRAVSYTHLTLPTKA